MNIGDKVKLKYRPSISGVIVLTKEMIQPTFWSNTEYLVEYEDADLIPHKDWHTEETLELVVSYEDRLLKCDCGGAKTSTDHHYSWCKLNE